MFVPMLTIFSYLFGGALTGIQSTQVNGYKLFPHGHQQSEDYNYMAFTSISNQYVVVGNRSYIDYDFDDEGTFTAEDCTADNPYTFYVDNGNTSYPLADFYYDVYGGIPTITIERPDNAPRLNVAFSVTYFPYALDINTPFTQEGYYCNFDLSLPRLDYLDQSMPQSYKITASLFDDDDIDLSSYFKLVFNFFTISQAQYNNANSREASQFGYAYGYSEGYTTGYQDGIDYQIGQADNDYNSGYASGQEYGYQSGYKEGYTNGQNDGYTQGWNGFLGSDEYYNNLSDSYEQGQSVGYQQGYYAGLTDENDYTFRSLFGAIADTPILFIRQLLGFDVFGVSAITILMTMITGVIVLHLFRKVVL